MKRFFFVLRLLLSGGLIFILLNQIELEEVTAVATSGSISFILIAYALGIVDRILMAYKWNILLKAKAIHIPLTNLTITYITTTFLGLFLPATVGADALRAYAIAKEGHRTTAVVSSIIIERIIGLIALTTLVLSGIILSIFVLGQHFFVNIWNLFWIILAVFTAISALLYLSLKETALRRISSAFIKHLDKPGRGQKLVKTFKNAYRSYLSYRDNRIELTLFFLLSLAENLFPILWSYFLSLAFNMNIPLVYFFILIPLVLILRRLPISIDGIGIHEGAFVYFLSFIGVIKSEALLLGIATHLFAIALVLPGGILYIFSGIKIRNNADLPTFDTPDSSSGNDEELKEYIEASG